MNEIHEKSPCCRGKIRLYGTRRRQCSVCKKTWRVWKRKRGRKERRFCFETLYRYFNDSLIQRHLKKRTVSARLRKILTKFNEEEPWEVVPTGPLIAIADALIEYIEGYPYTVYFILVRSINGTQAVILPPFMLIEAERGFGWDQAFQRIPSDILNRIVALVCDGHAGLISAAHYFGWVVQRCHFHLLARIAHNASFGPLGKNRPLGIRIQKLVHIVLYAREMSDITLALDEIRLIKSSITSRTFRTVLSGFLKNYDDYRSYVQFPQYHLPATSNTAEHLVGLVRDLQYRAHGFRTPASLFAWINGYCKYQKTVTCRSKIQPN